MFLVIKNECRQLIFFVIETKNKYIHFFLSLRFFFIWTLFIILSYIFLDRSIAEAIQNNSNHPLIHSFTWITEFGRADPYLILFSLWTLSARYVFKNKALTMQGSFLLLSIIIPGFLSMILKIIFGRNRICLYFDENLYDFHWFIIQFNGDYASFPSGHTTTIVGIMLAIILLYPKWIIPFVAFAFTVSISRIFVEAHFLSDILMGMYIGSIVTLLIYFYFEMKGWLPERFSNGKNTHLLSK